MLDLILAGVEPVGLLVAPGADEVDVGAASFPWLAHAPADMATNTTAVATSLIFSDGVPTRKATGRLGPAPRGKYPSPLGQPPQAQSIMIVGYDGNKFVFWHPDAGHFGRLGRPVGQDPGEIQLDRDPATAQP